MAHRFEYRRRVTFAETDLAGIVHFANFYRYMEEAEHAFYRSLGFSVHPTDEPRVGWPRVHASCDFRRPLRFEDEFIVEVLIEEIRSKVLRHFFRFWKETGPGGERELLAHGRMTAVCVAFDAEKGTMRAVEIPAAIRAVIEEAPPEALHGTGD